MTQLFSWVEPDGLGDYFTLLEMAAPQRDPHLVIALPEGKTLPYTPPYPHEIYFHKNNKKQPPLSLLTTLKPGFMQISSFVPFFEYLKPLTIAEYGQSHNPLFAPGSGRYSLGLEPDELGIFFPKVKKRPFSALKNRRLALLLEKKRGAFNFCYTKTRAGTRAYMHKLMQNEGDITLALFKAHHILDMLEDFDLKQVDFYFRKTCSSKKYKERGRTLTLIALESLAYEDFLILTAQTETLFGCTGDHSLSLALSLELPYYYDAPPHKIKLRESLKKWPDIKELKAKRQVALTREIDRWGRRGCPLA